MVYQTGPSIFTKRTLLLWALWAESQARQGDQRIEASPHIRIVTADRLCPRLSWWAAAAAAAGGGGGGGCPLALRCLFGGSSDQSSYCHCRMLRFSVRAPSIARKATTQQSVRQFWLTRTASEEQPGFGDTPIFADQSFSTAMADGFKNKDLAKTCARSMAFPGAQTGHSVVTESHIWRGIFPT